MPGKLFTLADANRLLPLVRSITRDAVARYRAAKEAIRALEILQRTADEATYRDAVDRQDAVIADHLDGLQRLVRELEDLGCRLRDYERGAVDFPAAALTGDGFVVYCWALGEDRVTHWHVEGEGFEERRLLPAAG